VLIQAKSELEHGQFIDWVVNELRFGTRKVGVRDADIRKAEMLMFLARNEVISKSCHWHDFPPSPRTLWELTQRSSGKAGGHRCAHKRRTVLRHSVIVWNRGMTGLATDKPPSRSLTQSGHERRNCRSLSVAV
jgi:hypothetical protein